MMVWNFPCRAAGPSPTSMYLLSGETGEASWAWVRACASSRDSNLVDGEHTSRDLGRDKVAWPTDARCRKTLIGNMSLNSWCWKLSIQWCRKRKLFSPVFITCAFTDQSAEFGAEEDINVIEDELHYHWLNAHLHEGRCATEAGWLYLFWPIMTRNS